MDGQEPLPYQFEPTRANVNDSIDTESDISDNSDESTDRDVETEEWRLDSDAWCTCGHCERMPTIVECLCCKEMTELEDKIENLDCITFHPDFDLICLHPEVLRTGLVARWDIRRDVLEDPIPHWYVRVVYINYIM